MAGDEISSRQNPGTSPIKPGTQINHSSYVAFPGTLVRSWPGSGGEQKTIQCPTPEASLAAGGSTCIATIL